MVKRIVFSRKAFADIDRIVEFNNRRNRSDTYSKKFVKNLNQDIKVLSKQPSIGIITEQPDELLFIWDSYYIFYFITDTTVEITSIYHQKENIDR